MINFNETLTNIIIFKIIFFHELVQWRFTRRWPIAKVYLIIPREILTCSKPSSLVYQVIFLLTIINFVEFTKKLKIC